MAQQVSDGPPAGVASRAASLAYGAGWTLSKRLPEPWVARSFDAVAQRATARGGRGVVQLRANLRRARPDLDDAGLDELVAQAMRSYLRYWREAFRLPTWDAEEIRSRLIASNPGRLFDPLDSGRGVVAVLGHFGNWDHAGAWVTAHGRTFTTVAERLRPESLYDRFVAYRESLGMEVLPLSRGPDVTEVLQQRLRAGGLVALLADRDLTGTGVDVDLLGESARLPAGPALLALRTGSVLLPVFSSYDAHHTRLDFGEPLTSSAGGLKAQVQDLTGQWADALGSAIRERAPDWHMLQPVWSADHPVRAR